MFGFSFCFIIYLQAVAAAEFSERRNVMAKYAKELAVEAAVEYVKSWNASDSVAPMKFDEFIELIKKIYDTLTSFDKK